jgi:caa(3)-type oxidase subunit IV
MTTAHSDAGHGHHEDAHAAHAHPNYIKIWGVLVALLVVSVLGPMVGIKAVTLITAFGIAFVKAYLVATRFMHLDIEKKYITYLLVTCLAFMMLLFSAVAPDVMNHKGQRWVNKAAQDAVERGLAAQAEHGGDAHHPAPETHH